MQVDQNINSLFASNTFIISSKHSDDVWLVDIGDMDATLGKISKFQKIKGVFITHTHYDHIYGIRDLIAYFPDCKIYTSINGKKGFLSDQYNFSKYHEDPIILDTPNIEVVKEGNRINLFDDYYIEVFETPGHDWSCLTYKLGDDILFTGDSFIPGLKVITSFPKSNKKESEKSLQKIYSLISGPTIIYPGHGDNVRYP